MPLREFQCLKCKEVFEVLVFKNQEEQDLSCPRCGGKRLTKLLSLFAHVGGNDGGALAQASCGSCSGKTCSTCH